MEDPAALLLDDAALYQKFLDDVHHEERVAIRVLVDDPRQRGGLLIPWQAPRQVLGHGRLTQACQRQLRTVPMHLQGLLHAA